MRTVALHGRTVSYREAGEGPVLLLIHGMAGTSEGWDAVIGPLARHHTVIAPDFPGHGNSEPGGGDYEDFIASTEPADFDREEWRARFAHA